MKRKHLFAIIVLIAVVVLVISTKAPMMEASQSSIEEQLTDSEEYKNIIEETEKLNQEKGVQLTPYQYYITQKGGTEIPFDNEFWDNKEPGIYVDIVSGEPLFSSLDKYDSGTGWPSFTKPLEVDNIEESEDNKLIVSRTALSSKDGTQLGHVFNDGPVETGGERYCINSASLKFIHKDDLEEEGYEDYLSLFEN